MAKIIDLTPEKLYKECFPVYRGSTRFLEYKNLFANAIKIKGLDFATETFVKNQLIDVGQVGYDRMADKWAGVFGEGINELRNPTSLFFVFPNIAAYTRKAYYEPNEDGAYLIKAMPFPYSITDMIRETCRKIDESEISINQNLKANRTPFYFVTVDPDLKESIIEAQKQALDGKPSVVVTKSVAEAVKGISVNSSWLVDRIVEYRDGERDRLLNKLGLMTANIGKRERVQVGEVNATVGQCVDYIYLIIDTFNAQMKTYGLPFEMTINNALEEYYAPDESSDEGKEEGEENETR